MIVVDVNVLAFYLIEGNRTVEANALREKDPEWVLPAFWRFEFQSILWKYARFGGMPADHALELLDQAIGMFSINEVTPAADIVLRDALHWGITVYDAQYVSLARQMGIRCVTEDGSVQEACPTIAISLDDALKGRAPDSIMREPRTTYRTRRKK